MIGGGFISNMRSSIRNNRNLLHDKKSPVYFKRKVEFHQRDSRQASKEEKDQLKAVFNDRKSLQNKKMILWLVIFFIFYSILTVGLIYFF